MAGSRLANFGTIFTRVTGLLESGAIKETPLWYNVYKKYPPDLEPRSDRPLPDQSPVPELVYEEDFERAAAARSKLKPKKAIHVSQEESIMQAIGDYSKK